MAEGKYGGECVEQHTAMIYDRGGKQKLHVLVDVASVRWGRVRDGKSAAEIVISGRACRAQTAVLNSIESSRHELVLFRGDERVWEGPIRVVKTYRNRAVITAVDIKEYLDFTSLTKDWPAPSGGGPNLMADRLSEIILYELTTPYTMETNQGTVTVPRWETIADPINVLPFFDASRVGTVLTRSESKAFEMTVGEHMDNLCDGGLDYTVIGRKLIIWDSNLSIGQTRKVTDVDFYGDIEVGQYGVDHVSISHISAEREDEESGVSEQIGVGHAGAENAYYGVWETITSRQNESTTQAGQTALNSQAQRGLTGRTPPPIEVRIPSGSGVKISHDLTFDQLVPGTILPISALLNIRVLHQTQRIDSVSVTESAGSETIQLSMSPFGEVEE